MSPLDHGRAMRVRPSRALSFALVLALGLAGCAGAGAGAHPAGSEPPLQAFQIRAAQRKLSTRGFRVEPTGVWDEPTRFAIAEFQASKGLPKTGRLDWATADALGVNPDPMFNCEVNDTVDCAPGGGP